MSAVELVIAIAAVTAGAIVHGSVGVGLGLVAGPALVAINPDFIPGPLLLVGQVMAARHIIVERAHIDWRALKNCLWGLPFGVAGGILLLVYVPELVRVLIIGGVTAVAAAALLAGFELRQTRRVEIGGGLTCSFSALAASMPGPPMAIAFSTMKPGALRSTASVYIMLTTIVGIAIMIPTGTFRLNELTLVGYLLPGQVLGMLIARYVRPYLDRTWFRPAVLTVALAGGLALVIGQLV